MTPWPGIPLRQQVASLLAPLVLAMAIPISAGAGEPRTLRINQYDTPEDCIADRTTPACALATTLQSTVLTAQLRPEDMPILARILEVFLSATERPAPDEVVVPVAIDYRIISMHIYDNDPQSEFLDLHPDWKSVPEHLRPSALFEPGMAEIKAYVRYYDAEGLAWPPSDWPDPNNWQHETYRFMPDGDGWQSRGSGRTIPFREITEQSDFSPCIGDPRTPLCAVETYVACRVRNDAALCEVADETYPDGYEAWDGPETFQVESMLWESDHSSDGHPSTITIQLRGLPFQAENGEYNLGLASRYTVTRFGDQWRVTDREAVSD